MIDVVVFGSPCKVYQAPTNKSTGKRSATDIIVGKTEETNGYQLYQPQFQTVIAKRHVSQIETLKQEGYDQLTQVLHDEAEDALKRLALDRKRNQGREERVPIAEYNSIPPPADHEERDEDPISRVRRSGR